MAPLPTRTQALATVLATLKSQGSITDEALVHVAGTQQGKEIIELMLRLGACEHDGNRILASNRLIMMTPESFSPVEDYVFGAKEAQALRTIQEALGVSYVFNPLVAGLSTGPKPQEKPPVPDPEIVKRFAKNFIDVSDIGQKKDTAAGVK